MSDKARRKASTTGRVVSALQELISALDRRLPQPERPGETRIAGDAARLRHQAAARINSLARVGVGNTCFNQGLAEAVMTDDGGPTTDTTPIVIRSQAD